MINDVNGIPQIGLGTFGRTGDDGLAALLEGIEAGYRHIDTAQSYDTERNVGEAIRQSGIPHNEFFITTKIVDTKLRRDDALASVEGSLEALGVDRVDLLLIHWPSFHDEVPIEEYLNAAADCRERGQTRMIGVSNFTIDHLKRTEAVLGKGVIATNQVELHPYLQSPKLTGYAAEIGLPLTAYQPLAQGKVADDPVLSRIAEAHGVTAAAISLAFLMAEGHIVIPASSNAQRLRDNLAAQDVSLSEAEVGEIRGLDRAERLIQPPKSPDWDDR
ncbi:aldo/keto reductase [Pelagovum pacificum]|uniref:Aldo/keto reductase n=1 Tax=Pelagovum pacificum TaxID=2588711 RepID=A0A5C5GIU9_9RHOB|nr:aldo/keto reductase [Pelagovum pacificum]QQA43518.1 aldo/keto reductase [Pelagovum pacificum]TNY33346.1 aldo/keto reductase [Pelagovum pacificum]